ncbi:hypothetical protein KAR91_21005 [Candidatus Pacearchaeota archaeon]|nr:hypothetical protein [Candidatus Pacearchaeota archaeon]
MAKPIELEIDTTKAIQKLKEVQKEADKIRKQIPLKVTVRAGDAIIFTHPTTLSESAHARLLRQLETLYIGCKVLLLEENMKLTGCIEFAKSDNSEEHF